MKKYLVFLCVTALVFIFVANAGATALLVQTDNIWDYLTGTLQPYNALTQAAVSYDRVSHQELATTDLSNYDFLYLVGSDGDTAEFDTYVDMNQISAYVQAGGLALIHYAEWSGDYTDIGPDGVDGAHCLTDTGNINQDFATDPLFDGVTDDDLDDWSSTAHGYLTDLPAGADVLITNENGYPIYARYQYGNGEVWITTMTLEWGKAVHHDLLLNELKLADDYSPTAPVPEPSTMLLLGTGLIGLAGYGRKKMSKKS